MGCVNRFFDWFSRQFHRFTLWFGDLVVILIKEDSPRLRNTRFFSMDLYTFYVHTHGLCVERRPGLCYGTGHHARLSESDAYGGDFKPDRRALCKKPGGREPYDRQRLQLIDSQYKPERVDLLRDLQGTSKSVIPREARPETPKPC